MLRIIFWLGGVVIVLAFIVIGLDLLLTPDNLAKCNTKPDKTTGCQKAEIIIAVSGGDTTARARSAIELYKNGWANKIIFSGAARDPKAPSNAAVMRDLAIKSGVPSSTIILDETSKTTRENSVNVATILKKINARSAILVSSPYHLRRVAMNFTAKAPNINFRTSAADDKTWHLWFLKPQGWWIAISELGGIIKATIGGLS